MPAVSNAESDLELLRSELKDRTSELEQQFMALEQAHSEGKATIEALHLILRQAHSLKGSLSMADRTEAAQAVHAMETAFVALREGRLTISSELFDLAFASLDQISRAGEPSAQSDGALRDLAAKWNSVQDGAKDQAVQGHAGLPFDLLPDEAARLRTAIAQGQHLYLVEKSILSAITKEMYETLPIYEDISGIGVLIAQRPAFADIDPKQRETVLLLLAASPLDAQALGNEIFDPTLPVSLSEADRQAHAAKSVVPPSAKNVTEGLRCLVVEDDFTSRLLLQKFLAPFGEAHVAVDGEEALAAVKMSLDENSPYQLICLDIMMPKLDGQAVLHNLRQLEEEHGILLGNGAKVVMTTCLSDYRNIMDAFRGQCDAYVVKPVERSKLMMQLHQLGLLPP